MTVERLRTPVTKAVFPVAGLGSRFLPATKVLPKEMLPVCDRPLIQYAVEEAREAGIEEFIFVTGRNKELLEEHFDVQAELEQTLEERGKDKFLEIIRQTNMPAAKLFCTRQPQPLGLGHAIWCAKDIIGNAPFAIILPDVLVKGPRGCLAQMNDVYREHGGNVIAVEEVPREETYKYGVIDTDDESAKVTDVKGLVEKPDPAKAPSNLSVTGRYILQPEIFEHLSKFEKGAGNEIQLTDAMAGLIGNQPFSATRFEGKSYDSGSRKGFIEANIAYALDDPEIGKDVRAMIEHFAANLQTEPGKHAAAE